MMMISKSFLLVFLAAATTEAFAPSAPRPRVAAPLVLNVYTRSDSYYHDTPPGPMPLRDDYLPVEEEEPLPPPPRYQTDPYSDDVYNEPYARDYDNNYDYDDYYYSRRNEFYDDVPRRSSQADHFYEPTRRSRPNWDTTYVDDRTQSVRRPLTNDPQDFYENRNYEAPLRGDRWAESIHRRKATADRIPGMDDYMPYPNPNQYNARSRQTHRAVSMESDSIPGRDQGYVDSKEEFLSNRREDLWSRFFHNNGASRRGRRYPGVGGTILSKDLEDTVQNQQLTLKPLLREVYACVESDPVCREVLGPDIQLDQPLTQSQTSSSRNGRREPSQVELQLRAHGRRGVGTLDVFATDIGITELILTVPGPRGEPRRIYVNLGVPSKAGIDIVDRSSPRNRGEGYVSPFLPRAYLVPNVMDAEFEVLNPQNQTIY